MSLSLRNITKKFGEQKAVDNLSFEIESGNIVGFLGPNGAGKSTTMKMITGYLTADEGTIDVCGLDVSENELEVKKLIGYLPEHNPLYPEMYIREYLTFVANLYELPNVKESVDIAIEHTGLTKEIHKKINQISKGYRQRVGLAQAIIHNPDILILDEPTSGLDPLQLEEIRTLIKNIGQEKTVMLSTHIMQEVEALCDRVIIINDGKIIADDKTKDINKSKKQESVVVVEFSETIEVNKLEKLKSHSSVSVKENQYFISFPSSNDKKIREEIFKLSVKEGWTILNMKAVENNLEKSFKELTDKK